MTRQCGNCQLCCKLLPMRKDDSRKGANAAALMIENGMATIDEFRAMALEFNKPAGARCPHQCHGKGCRIYPQRPFGCRMWSCRWLLNDGTNALPRPDRAHYVIDMMPDYLTATLKESGATEHVQVIQIWLDPDYPDAHQDPRLRDFLAREAQLHRKAALVRLDSKRAFSIWAPAFFGQWIVSPIQMTSQPQHSVQEILAAAARQAAGGPGLPGGFLDDFAAAGQAAVTSWK